jgi:hypothetical protein
LRSTLQVCILGHPRCTVSYISVWHEDETLEWSIAAETHFATKGLSGRPIDEEIHRLCEVYIGRYGYISTKHVQAVLRDFPGINTSNYESHLKKAMKYVSKDQFQTTSY